MANFTVARLGRGKSCANRWWNPQQDKIRKSVICWNLPLIFPLLAESCHTRYVGHRQIVSGWSSTHVQAEGAATAAPADHPSPLEFGQTRQSTETSCLFLLLLGAGKSCLEGNDGENNTVRSLSLAQFAAYLRLICCVCVCLYTVTGSKSPRQFLQARPAMRLRAHNCCVRRIRL